MIKSLKEIMSPFVLCNIYFSKFQCFYGLEYYFFLGGGDNSNKTIFRIQKRVT